MHSYSSKTILMASYDYSRCSTVSDVLPDMD